MQTQDAASALLTVDLDAIVANWRALARMSAPAECAAVVKADAYGLGVARVAPALHAAGCRTFFTATVEEALALRPVLPRDAAILALNGAPHGAASRAAAAGVVPVVNTEAQLADWRDAARDGGETLPLALQLDTGMSRFGLPPETFARLASGASALDGLEPVLLMSHLGCADTPDHPANAAQRAALAGAAEQLRAVARGPFRLSLAASSGIFLGAPYRFDLVRPGAALYGVSPAGDHSPNPMRGVVHLEARVMQVRTVPPGAFVGYGASWVAARPTRVATIAAGYADGFLRSGGNRGAALSRRGARLPVIGRVSMDSVTLDATDAPEDDVREGDLVTLIGPGRPVDAVAADAGTIGYEILTALGGGRFRRLYREDVR